jgi:hypothetical protein
VGFFIPTAMKYLILFLGLSSLINLEKHFVTRQYKSQDSATGGFEEIYFQLKGKGSLSLIDSVAIWKGEAKSGGMIYEWQLDTLISGNWELKKDSIFCHFAVDHNYLDSLFISKGFRTKGLRLTRSTIIFPERTDTLYIRNVPCVSND